MLRKILASLAAAAVFSATLAPVEAAAQRRGYYERDHRDHYRGRRHHHYRDRDNGDAVAAGVVGLIVGLAIGSMTNQDNRRVDCRDNYQRCPPPRYYDERREGAYYEDDSAYAREYGLEGGPQGSYDPYYDEPRDQCVRQERQWDRYANRYVVVDVPC